MSLVKTLQNQLTCTTVPWFPVGSADARFLINEIVVGEESDVDPFGNRKSHFELYLDAMAQCGANQNPIQLFCKELQRSGSFNSAFQISNTAIEAKEFVTFTFEIIKSQKPWLAAAIFTFGREDLIPGMFFSMVREIEKTNTEDISIFLYYLERHIEIDGGHHSKLAIEMTQLLCGNNEEVWKEAEEAILKSLQMRIHLWDGVYKEIMKKR
jgi:hypothetical protein